MLGYVSIVENNCSSLPSVITERIHDLLGTICLQNIYIINKQLKKYVKSSTYKDTSFIFQFLQLLLRQSQQVNKYSIVKFKKVVDTKTCFYYLSKSRRKTGVDSESPITKLTEVLDDKIRVFQVRMQCEYKRREQIFSISQLNQVKNESQSSVDFLSLYLLVSSYIWSTKFTGKNSIFSEELILMFVSAAILVPS